MVKPLSDHRIYVEIQDGRKGIFDVKPYLDLGFFRELKDVNYFKIVDILFGAVTWPSEQDTPRDAPCGDGARDLGGRSSDTSHHARCQCVCFPSRGARFETVRFLIRSERMLVSRRQRRSVRFRAPHRQAARAPQPRPAALRRKPATLQEALGGISLCRLDYQPIPFFVDQCFVPGQLELTWNPKRMIPSIFKKPDASFCDWIHPSPS